MINQAIGWVQLAVLASAAFVATLVLSVVVPEAIRRRWPLAMALLAASAVVVVEVATEEVS